MAKDAPNHTEESVHDLIDDAAQLLHRIPAGLYFDAQRRPFTIEKSSGVTTMILANGEMQLIVTCIEDKGGGKIERIVLQGPQGKRDLYWALRFSTYNFCIVGDYGEQIMHGMIDKLQHCTPQKTDKDNGKNSGAKVIHLATRRNALNLVAQVTDLAAAFERRE